MAAVFTIVFTCSYGIVVIYSRTLYTHSVHVPQLCKKWSGSVKAIITHLALTL